MSTIQILLEDFFKLRDELKTLNLKRKEINSLIDDKNEEILNYLLEKKQSNNSNDDIGLQYNNYVICLKNLQKFSRKNKNEKISSMVEILENKGISDSKEVAIAILNAQKGEKFEKNSLKIINYDNNK